MAEQVYHNEVIEENPFPGETSEAEGESVKSSSGEVYSPTVSKENSFRVPRIATELMSQALNTRSKKILQNFDLEDRGGFKIGNYKEGSSGEIAFTPLGMVMKDTTGVTTVALYAADGSAVFKGTVQAGSIISASEIVGGSININDIFTVDSDGNVTAASLALTGGSININDKFTVDSDGNVVVNSGQITVKDDSETTIIDSKGLISSANFAFDSLYNGTQRNISSSNTWEDISNTSLTFSLGRASRVLIMTFANLSWYSWGDGDYISLDFALDIDGTKYPSSISGYGSTYTCLDSGSAAGYGYARSPTSTHYVANLSSGSHTIKMKWRRSGSSTVNGTVFHTVMSYIVLGK